eukprot:9215369-Prorocentrum_lima.AAC.1
MLQWLGMWASGALPTAAVQPWTHMMAVPLLKDKNKKEIKGKIRPIALLEAWTKLAEAVLLDNLAPTIRAAAGLAQQG